MGIFMALKRSFCRWFGRVEISGWQMRGFPIHRHLNPGAAAGVIEENECFERTWIEFAIGAEFQRDLRLAIRFARRIDAELVGFAFGYSRDRVENRRHKKCK